MSRIWDEEAGRYRAFTVPRFDPGDIDTPLHAAAVPDADRSTLKRPEVAALGTGEFYCRDAQQSHRGRRSTRMIAATVPVQRPRDAKLLTVDAAGNVRHRPRSDFPYPA